MGDKQAASKFTRTRANTSRARELRRNTSKTEARLWPRLRDGQLGASFRRQHPVGPYFADYCCVPLRLIVEIDGPLHEPLRDSARDQFLSENGFVVMRFSVQEIDERIEEVVEAVWRRVGEFKMARDGISE